MSKTAEQKKFEIVANEKNSLTYWYPKIVNEVNTPKTTIVDLPKGWFSWLDKGVAPDFVSVLKKRIKEEDLGYPVFLRTDQIADKHNWTDTCYVEHEKRIGRNLYTLLETNVMLDMAGELTPKAVVLRELLELYPLFTAYRGMPVSKEFRFFATKGQIDCYHPYWPHKSLEEGNPSIKNWREYLQDLEDENDLPIDMVKAASKKFSDQMSIDVCVDKSLVKWFVTDMALGAASFHWKHGDPTGGEDQ